MVGSWYGNCFTLQPPKPFKNAGRIFVLAVSMHVLFVRVSTTTYVSFLLIFGFSVCLFLFLFFVLIQVRVPPNVVLCHLHACIQRKKIVHDFPCPSTYLLATFLVLKLKSCQSSFANSCTGRTRAQVFSSIHVTLALANLSGLDWAGLVGILCFSQSLLLLLYKLYLVE